jgi:ABC-type dipeptide/oligopeptide/nickel transport system permease subunit
MINIPAHSEDSMQTGKAHTPAWLIILNILSLASLVAWPFVAFMSIFAFDAPGSADNPAVWTGVIAVLSYPVLPIAGASASFVTYRRGRRVASYVLAGIAAVPLIVIVLGFIAIIVGNLVFLLAGKL